MDVGGTLRATSALAGKTALEGRLEITRDRAGLKLAKALGVLLRQHGVGAARSAPDFVPWSGDAVSIGICGLTVENSPERVAIYGKLEIGPAADPSGAALLSLADACLAILAKDPHLPETVDPGGTVDTVPNPFA
jgi:hypothetical protein